MGLSELSGRLDTVETQQLHILQQLLLKIDIQTQSALQATVNNQLDAFGSVSDGHETRLDNLEGLYSSLVLTLNNHIATFTGHTGSLTGDGVHGHS